MQKENVLVIGFSGKKYSGKNTSALIALEYLYEYSVSICANISFQQIAYANALKKWVSLISGLPIQDFTTEEGKAKKNPGNVVSLEKIDQDSFVTILMKIGEKSILKFKELYYKTAVLLTDTNLTLGQLLQIVGTDIFRETFSKEIWIQFVQATIFPNCNPTKFDPSKQIDRIVFITDVRFENEADWIKELYGYVIRIERKDRGVIDQRNSSHPSETSLDNYMRFDSIIHNNGTLKKFKIVIQKLMENVVSEQKRIK
jgi:hypothetical protein